MTVVPVPFSLCLLSAYLTKMYMNTKIKLSCPLIASLTNIKMTLKCDVGGFQLTPKLVSKMMLQLNSHYHQGLGTEESL